MSKRWLPMEVAAMSEAEARSAHAEWEVTPRDEREGSPPMHVWRVAHEWLPKHLRDYEAHGTVDTLLEAVQDCHGALLPPPTWLRSAATRLRERIRHGEYEDLAELFGVGSKPQPRHRDREHRYVSAVQDALRRRDRGEKVTAAVEAAAKENGVSFSALRREYYDHIKKHPITEVVCADGWVYRKRTGEPDHKLRRDRPLRDL